MKTKQQQQKKAKTSIMKLCNFKFSPKLSNYLLAIIILTLKTLSIVSTKLLLIFYLLSSNPLAKYVLQDRALLG